MRITVHRGTQEIGGNCIELDAGTSRLLLDVGRPLDAPAEATDLLPRTVDRAAPVDSVLLSHPHQDHYGMGTPAFLARVLRASGG